MLDLREGIDLAIYLKVYERSTVHAYKPLVEPGSVIIDVGANIGAHTLLFARMAAPGGRIIAFEPTEYAFRKMALNIEMNEDLAPLITTCQAMLVESPEDKVPEEIYPSWPIDHEGDIHPKLMGRLKPTRGARTITLDDYLADHNIAHIDLIKMDVDGFECSVLRGAKKTLLTCRPKIIMELAPYLLDGYDASVDELLAIIAETDYRHIDTSSGEFVPYDREEIWRMCPD